MVLGRTTEFRPARSPIGKPIAVLTMLAAVLAVPAAQQMGIAHLTDKERCPVGTVPALLVEQQVTHPRLYLTSERVAVLRDSNRTP